MSETTGYAQDPDEKRQAKLVDEWPKVWIRMANEAAMNWRPKFDIPNYEKVFSMNQLHLDEALTRLQAHAQWLGRPVGSSDGDESYTYPKALMIDDIGVVLQALNRQPEVVEG